MSSRLLDRLLRRRRCPICLERVRGDAVCLRAHIYLNHAGDPT